MTTEKEIELDHNGKQVIILFEITEEEITHEDWGTDSTPDQTYTEQVITKKELINEPSELMREYGLTRKEVYSLIHEAAKEIQI